MRASLQGPSPSIRRRKAQLPSWLAAFTAAILLATLATGMATAATGATAATNDPTVISDWNEIAVTTLAGDTTKQGMGRRLTDWTLDHHFQPIHEEQER